MPPLSVTALARFEPKHRKDVQTYWCLMMSTAPDIFESGGTGELVQFACNLAEAVEWSSRDLGLFADTLLIASCTSPAVRRRPKFAMLAAVVRNIDATSDLLISLFAKVDADPADCKLSAEELRAAGISEYIRYRGEGPGPLTFKQWVRCIGDIDPFVVDAAERLNIIIKSKKFDLGEHEDRMRRYRAELEEAASRAEATAARINAEYAPASGNPEDSPHQVAMRDVADDVAYSAGIIRERAGHIGSSYHHAAGFRDMC